MEDDNVPKFKGTLFYNVKNQVLKDYGMEKWDELVKRCSPETQEILSKPLLALQWYPEKAFAELAQSVLDVFGPDICWKFNRDTAKFQMNFVYKMLLKLFVSPMKFAENNAKLWDTLHNTGKLTIKENLEKTHTIEISNFDFITKAYEVGFVEFHCGVIELTGGKNVKGTTTKVGPKKYLMKFHWE